MKFNITILWVFAFMHAQSQNAISGTILDAETNDPLEQVSVYFPQLEKGTVSNAEGQFKMENLPKGGFKIVASYIGYRAYSATIEITEHSTDLTILLQPSVIEMEEVILSTPFHKLQRENVMKVTQESMADLRVKGIVTLADGITSMAGVDNLSTGVGIGKPVIRGLSSNRVLVYTQGIRLENQQYGDEHGLGIADAGIESIEVIKGPASLLYGSDALGGVLYLNPEKFAPANTTEGDINFSYFTNTIGYNTHAGLRSSGEHFKYLVRAALNSHTDYKMGGGERVTNSRFKDRDLKVGFGYGAGNFKTELRYNFNSSDLGIPEEIGLQTTQRQPNAPYQQIDNHILSSSSDLFLRNSSLKLTLGYIFNNRKEFEEATDTSSPTPASEAALNMKLSTFNYNAQYHLPKIKKLETIVGIQGMHQTNTNFGEEVLIPDAVTNDFGIMATSHLHFTKSDMQIGLRYDNRSLRGSEYGTEGQTGYIPEIKRSFNSYNAALGYRIDVTDNIIGRVNLASGFRAPNLAELTSNGIHEGTNRYEVGNPDLLNEKNLQADLALEYNNEHFEFFINSFYNGIQDFIFIEPNGTFIGGEEVYVYRQQDARLYGGEIGIHIHPHPLDWLHLESSFESVRGKLDNDEDLPLIPANSLNNTLRMEFNHKESKLQTSYVFMTLRSVFSQGRVGTFETSTSGYNLLNAGIGVSCKFLSRSTKLQLSATNLLDKTYVSHLSRLKSDGIYNMGRNIVLSLNMPF